SGGNNNVGNNGGNVTPPKPTVPAGMSPKAPNQNTGNSGGNNNVGNNGGNVTPPKDSAGVSATEIK
ncbi:MAG: hypothetical protein ACTIDP_09940, partial [Lactococcus cremoris]